MPLRLAPFLSPTASRRGLRQRIASMLRATTHAATLASTSITDATSSILAATPSHSRTAASITTALTILATLTLLAPPAHAQWSVTYLHPPGQLSSHTYAAYGTQQAGQVSPDAFFPRASIWNGTPGSRVSLHPTGARDSLVVGTNGTHQVGFTFFESDQITRATIWAGTAASWTSLHPANSTESYARGIAGSQQVGYADFGPDNRHAGLWSGTAASWVDLHPAGATSSDAHATSGTQQVGVATINNITRASLWNGTAASRIDLHPAGADVSSATAATTTHQAGWAFIGGESHAGLWSGSAASWVDLNPASSTYSLAHGIFGSQQVGIAMIDNNFHASLWNGSAASWIDLSTFLTGSWRDTYASGIYSDGTTTTIAGYGFNLNTNNYEALLWRQTVPAPAAAPLLALAGLLTPRRRR